MKKVGIFLVIWLVMALLMGVCFAELIESVTLREMNFSDKISQLFDNCEVLMVAESLHHLKENDELIVSILKSKDDLTCHVYIAEASTAGWFLYNDYISPEKHSEAKKYASFTTPQEKQFFDDLYRINLLSQGKKMLRVYGIEGYMNTAGTVLNAWKYFLNAYMPEKAGTEFGKTILEGNADQIISYISNNEKEISSEMRRRNLLEKYELLKKALEDIERRNEIDRAYKKGFSRGATMREKLSIDYFKDILANHSGENILVRYGGWHVKKGPSDVTNLYTYFNDSYAKTKGRVRSLYQIFSNINLKTAPESRDYSKMYMVYGYKLYLIHQFMDKHKGLTEMPIYEIPTDDSEYLKEISDKFATDNIRFISSQDDKGLFSRYDELVLFPVCNLYDIIPGSGPQGEFLRILKLDNPDFGMVVDGISESDARKKIVKQYWTLIFDGDYDSAAKLIPVIDVNRIKQLVSQGMTELVEVGEPFIDMEFDGKRYLTPARIRYTNGKVLEIYHLVHFREIDGVKSCVLAGEGAGVKWIMRILKLDNPDFGMVVDGISESDARKKIVKQYWTLIFDGDYDSAAKLIPGIDANRIKQLVSQGMTELVEVGEPFIDMEFDGKRYLTPARIRYTNGKVLEIYHLVHFREIDGVKSCVLAGEGAGVKWIN